MPYNPQIKVLIRLILYVNQNNLDNLKYLVTIIIVYWCTNIVQAGVQYNIICFVAVKQGAYTI